MLDGVVFVPIIKFCAEEVDRQGDTPLHVYFMVTAWQQALRDWGNIPNRYDLIYPIVERWGRLVSPNLNPHGFRSCHVWIRNIQGPKPSEISRLMGQLFEPSALSALEPWEIYREFEAIHPFRDGNGRVGKIVYNWMNGTLHDPVMPPNLYGDVRNP